VLTIKGQIFELTHVKLRASSHSHAIVFCASNRLVLEEGLTGKVAGLYGKLRDEKGDFTYACYVSSEYLTENVRAERTSFDITENIDGLFADSIVSFSEIRQAVIANINHCCPGVV